MNNLKLLKTKIKGLEPKQDKRFKGGTDAIVDDASKQSLSDVSQDVNDIANMGWTNKTWKEGGGDYAVRVMQEGKMLDALIYSKYKADKVPANFVKLVYSELTPHIKSFKPDIVFSWMNRATSMCPPKGAFIQVGRLGGYYNLKYYRDCDYLVANTEDIVTYVVNNGWSRDKVFYLPNFASEKWSQPINRQNFTTPSNAPLILAMGRLHENKAFDVLLEAVSRVPNVYLWLAGDGPLREVLETQAEKLGIKSRIRFLGWRNDPEKLYAAADMFVCPSRHEPLGNVIIESWAQRIPVIAADSLGPKDLICHGENGLLFSIDDVMSLVQGIKHLIEDNALREKLVSRANQDFAETYTESIVVAKYRKFFEKVSQ